MRSKGICFLPRFRLDQKTGKKGFIERHHRHFQRPLPLEHTPPTGASLIHAGRKDDPGEARGAASFGTREVSHDPATHR